LGVRRGGEGGGHAGQTGGKKKESGEKKYIRQSNPEKKKSQIRKQNRQEGKKNNKLSSERQGEEKSFVRKKIKTGHSPKGGKSESVERGKKLSIPERKEAAYSCAKGKNLVGEEERDPPADPRGKRKRPTTRAGTLWGGGRGGGGG